MKNTLTNYFRLLVKTLWRVMRGRWYVFRDAPLWFVRDMVDAASEENKHERSNGTFTRMFAEAKKEFEQRRFNAARFGKLAEFIKEWEEEE